MIAVPDCLVSPLAFFFKSGINRTRARERCEEYLVSDREIAWAIVFCETTRLSLSLCLSLSLYAPLPGSCRTCLRQ